MWNPHDFQIYYVNIDLRHQYGISVAESQTFRRGKRPHRRRVRRNGCFRRLGLSGVKSIAQRTNDVRAANRPFDGFFTFLTCTNQGKSVDTYGKSALKLVRLSSLNVYTS